MVWEPHGVDEEKWGQIKLVKTRSHSTEAGFSNNKRFGVIHFETNEKSPGTI